VSSTLIWSLAAGCGTTLGALLLVVWRRPSDRAYDLALSAGAGIMLAATVLGLLPAARAAGSFLEVAAGFALGAIFVAYLDHALPHWHARFQEGRSGDDEAHFTDADDAELGELDDQRRRAILLTSAISLHNLPEGMAVGAAFAAGGDELGVALAIAILVHNIPEGLAVALPIRAGGSSRRRAIAWTTLTGLVEVVGALAAYAIGTAVDGLLPWGLAFAGGAMLYVVIDEMIPAAHTRGEQRASLVFLAAFLGMAVILELLGGLIVR
jgi:ZIP family zinc transporter